MFDYKKNRTVSSIPCIKDNYNVILFEDGPVLYFGKNHLGNYIIGTSIDDDSDEKLQWFFHVVVDNETFFEFVSQKISYREIMEKSKDLYVLERSFDSSVQNYFQIDFSSIPDEYKPFPSSFCPEDFSITQTNISYSLHLTGLDANLHRIKPNTMAGICSNFEKLLKTLFSPLLTLFKTMDSQSFVAPSPIGSFNIKFDISLKHEPNVLNYPFDHDADTKDILDRFMKYCFVDLESEVGQLVQNSLPVKFDLLKKRVEEFLGKYNVKYDSERLLSDLRTKAINSTEIISDLTEKMGEDFEKIELLTSVPIAEIDRVAKDKISSACSQIETLTTTVDDKESDFDVHIYQMNVESRKGKANIRSATDKDKMINVSVRISGKEAIENTKFTASLHENRFISVRAKAKRANGVIKSLDVLFEQV